jgi:hypothetical protein
VTECACMTDCLWSIVLLVLCRTCYKSTSRSVGHHCLLHFVYFLIRVWFSTWVPLTIVFSASFSFGYPQRVPRIKEQGFLYSIHFFISSTIAQVQWF